MAVSSVRQQLCGSTDELHRYTGVYDCLSPFGEYAACLEVGNFCPQEDSFDGLDAVAADAETQSQHCASNQARRPIIYPWMKQRRRRRNGNVFF